MILRFGSVLIGVAAASMAMSSPYMDCNETPSDDLVNCDLIADKAYFCDEGLSWVSSDPFVEGAPLSGRYPDDAGVQFEVNVIKAGDGPAFKSEFTADYLIERTELIYDQQKDEDAGEGFSVLWREVAVTDRCDILSMAYEVPGYRGASTKLETMFNYGSVMFHVEIFGLGAKPELDGGDHWALFNEILKSVRFSDDVRTLSDR